MKFYNTRTSQIMSELRTYAGNDTQLVEKAMSMALREGLKTGKKSVSPEEIKDCIDKIRHRPAA